MTLNPCAVCSKADALLSCMTCSSAVYCSKTCQLKDSNNKHHKCMPYTILYEERCGRLLMAARDISAGEIIFTDIPGAVGPDNNPKPICLTCYKSLPGLVYRCRYCTWPLCSPFCQQDDGPHARECQLFRIHSPRFEIEDYKKACPWYNSIMTLRILWLRDNKPDTWRLLDMLMDHLEDSREEDKIMTGVVDFIHNHCKLTQFSKSEIRHVMGVIDTNAYIIGENPNNDVDLQGLFPITSIINHSCSANTICFARDNFTFSCRAVVNIKKGEELTTNYLHYHYHFFGLSYRRPELSEFWHFKCNCRRCKDYTEFGTMSDALVCKDCDQGRLMPLNMNAGAEWVCGTCYGSQTSEDVMMIITYWWNMIDKTSKKDIKPLLELLQKLLNVFDQNHFYPLEVKRKIIENIGDSKGNGCENLAEAWLEKKVDFCRDHLKIQKVLAPGISEYKAYLSSHIAEPLYWLAKKRFMAKKYSSEEMVKSMEEVAQHILMTIQIWGPYRRKSAERLKAEQARKLLEKIDSQYLHRNLGEMADEVLENDVLKIYTSNVC